MRFLWGILAVLFVGTQAARAQIAVPRLGYIRDESGGVRPVYGIAAAAALGNATTSNAISFSCSAKLCLVKTNDALQSFAPDDATTGQTTVAPSGSALISLNERDGSAWVYFREIRQFSYWQSGTLAPIDYSPDGRVLSLRATADGFDHAIVRDGSDTVWIEHYSLVDGSVTAMDSIEGAKAVMLLDHGVLFTSGEELVLRRPDGTQLTFAVSGARAMHQAGAKYVEISSPAGLWILNIDPGHEQLSMLPGMLPALHPTTLPGGRQ